MVSGSWLDDSVSDGSRPQAKRRGVVAASGTPVVLGVIDKHLPSPARRSFERLPVDQLPVGCLHLLVVQHDYDRQEVVSPLLHVRRIRPVPPATLSGLAKPALAALDLHREELRDDLVTLHYFDLASMP